jgi:hypothetical protein
MPPAQGCPEIRSPTMRTTHILLLMVFLPSLFSCGGQELESSTCRQDEVVVEGVRTVRTLSGSVWKEPARLVEEISIGSNEEGPYLLGSVMAVEATDDRIYILDSSFFRVRVYAWDGRHLFDFAGRGAGPGEFRMPTGLAVDTERGWVVVRDISLSRVNVYTLDGVPTTTWPLSSYLGSFRPTVITRDGGAYVPVTNRRSPRRYGMGRTGPREATLDTVWAPFFDDEKYQLRTEQASMSVPFSPELVWTFSVEGALIHGISDRYRITVTEQNGSLHALERVCEPVPVQREERDWFVETRTRTMRHFDPSFSWRGSSIPDTKPWFTEIVADRSGRLWIVREGPGVKVENEAADATPRWQSPQLVDVFEVAGRYLGTLESPDEVRLSSLTWIRDDVLITFVHSSDGVPRVKRYRIVIPR